MHKCNCHSQSWLSNLIRLRSANELVGCTSGVRIRASLETDPKGSELISGLADGFVI